MEAEMTPVHRANTFHFAPFKLLQNLGKLAVIWAHGEEGRVTPESWINAWNGANKRLCTDGASNRLMELIKREVRTIRHPDIIVGDFDSIHRTTIDFFDGKSQLVQMADQDSTDLSKALNLLRQDSAMVPVEAILILNSLDGRFDHIFGALNAILRHQNATSFQMPVFIQSEGDIVTLLPEGNSRIEVERGKVSGSCGIIPLCQRPTQVSTDGFKWNLDSHFLEYGGIVSTSNQLAAENLSIDSSAPLIFTFEILKPD